MKVRNRNGRIALVTTVLLAMAGCGGGGGGGSTASTSAPSVPWTGTKQLGATGAETYGNAVAIDAGGNVYVAGYTDGGLDGNTLTGPRDFFVTRYDGSGVKMYTNQLGVAGALTVGNSVATDFGRNVYVAGTTSGGLDGNARTGPRDFFVTKYDGGGVKLFTRQLGVAGAGTIGRAVATDGGGNIYVAGTTLGGLDGNTLTGVQDFFVTKYDSNGVRQFTRQLGAGGAATDGYSVATDAGGNVYVAGSTQEGLDGNTLMGTTDFFLTKYDGNGAKQYTRQLGVASSETVAYSVATDAGGNVYVAGYTDGGLDGNTLTGILNFFVTKYDSNGVKQYTRQLGAPGAITYGYSVATDLGGNVYVAGETTGALDGNTQTGSSDFFITKYDSNGVKLFSRQLGVTGTYTQGSSVAADASGNVYVAGSTSGGLDGNTLAGIRDFFVAKFDSVGNKK